MFKHKKKRDTSTYLFSNKDLVRLYVPLIIEQMLAMLVGLADSIMVSSVGESAVSGVSLVDSCFQLIINLFAALATGGAVTVGQYLGQKNKEKAGEAATQLVWFSMILSLGVMALMYAGKGLILNHVFGQIEADVYGHADTYMMIVNASIPFLALYNAGAAIFRSIGNSNISMRVSLIMNGINVAGNAILIYACKCGTEGVAIPTLVSRLAAAVIMIILLIPKKSAQAKQDSTRIYIKKSLRYRANWHMLKSILLVGIPNGLENSMFQLGKILVLSLVSTFGTYAIAANAVGNVIAGFQLMAGMAASLAMVTVVSRCVGAGDYEQAKYYTIKVLIMAYICIIVTVLFTFAVLPLVMKAYGLSYEAQSAAEKILMLRADLRSLGVKMGNIENPKVFARFLKAIKRNPLYPTLSVMVLRSMKRAVYDATAIGHFGLAKQYYAHFTSPIRRYPDLTLHRQLAAYLEKKNCRVPPKTLQQWAEHTSAMEEVAAEAERGLLEIKKYRLMEAQLKSGKKAEYDAVISKCTPFGCFVDIPELMISGLVHVSVLSRRYVRYNESDHSLSAPGGESWRIGDRMKVRVASVDFSLRRIDFIPVVVPREARRKKHK